MKVITSVVNNPRFIEIQYHTLKRHMKCEYEFIVFNDAKPFPDFTNGNDVTIRTRINETCKKLGIRCVEIPNLQHMTKIRAELRCADACNFMLKYQLDHPDKYLVIDSDMFLIDSFDYSNYDAAVVIQERGPIQYIWNGLVYFDTTRIMNKELLSWDPIPGCDVGGKMNRWLKQQPTHPPTGEFLMRSDSSYTSGKIYYIRHLWSCSWDLTELPESQKHLTYFLLTDPRNVNGKFFCEIYDGKFLHYRAGGNWLKEGLDLHNTLAEKLYRVLV